MQEIFLDPIKVLERARGEREARVTRGGMNFKFLRTRIGKNFEMAV